MQLKRNAYRGGFFRPFAVGLILSAIFAVVIGCGFAEPGDNTGAGNGVTVRTPVPVAPTGREIAVLSGGCFWSEQALFQQLKGVDRVVPGYAGGTVANPSYEQVCTETTGHAETVEITYEPKVISYHDLLTIFLTTHNPTTPNQQGADVGPSYRSAIWCLNSDQKSMAHRVIKEITTARVWPDPIVTQVNSFVNFYPAEAYHWDYYNRNPDQPYCQEVIAPKLAHFRALYRSRLK